MSIKKIISLIITIPALVLVVGDLKDNNLWWVQILALGVIVLVLAWNGMFKGVFNENKV